MAAAAPLDGNRPVVRLNRRGSATRARLVAAAKETFERDGFRESRVSDMTRRAGVSYGSYYHYFDSKQHVLYVIAENVIRRLSAPLDEVVFNPRLRIAVTGRVRRGIRQFLRTYRDDAIILGIIEQVARTDGRLQAIRAGQRRRDNGRLTESVRRLQRRGLADPAVDVDTAIVALGAMLDRFAEIWLVENFLSCSLDDAVDQLTRLYVNGLSLRDGPGDLD